VEVLSKEMLFAVDFLTLLTDAFCFSEIELAFLVFFRDCTTTVGLSLALFRPVLLLTMEVGPILALMPKDD
jgi:hypothetical protein